MLLSRRGSIRSKLQCAPPRKKKDADKNFDVDVKSMDLAWEEELSNSNEEDYDGIPKHMSATDIIGTARAKRAEHLRAHREAADAAWETEAQEAAAREAAAWEAASHST